MAFEDAQFYLEKLGLSKAIASPIIHEEAIVASVYEIKRADGQKFILKICPSDEDFLREVFFLQTLLKTLPVPGIHALLDPNQGMKGALLLECLKGNWLPQEELTPQVASQLGSLLAQLHMQRKESYGDPIKPSHLSADPRAYFYFKFYEGLEECRAHLHDRLWQQCSEYYETHSSSLLSVDGPCIVHRDFRLGNCIVNRGRVQGIIDWSSARYGFAQEDFVHDEWLIEPACRAAFFAGYSQVRLIPLYEELLPLLRLNKALAIVGFTLKRGTWNSLHATLYRQYRQFLDSFFTN